MGKIRIKAFDESSAEDEAKLKVKREAKKAEKMAAKNELRASQGKKINPQSTQVVTPEETVITADKAVVTPEETVKTTDNVIESESVSVIPAEAGIQNAETKKGIPVSETKRKAKKEKFAKANAKKESKRHKENMSTISKTQKYDLDQALTALKKFKKSKFDETVELHINTKEKGVSGTVTLPHGTGKTLIIKIADDAIIAEVAKGKINFDLLVATPGMMPSLAKVARVLGPRGLMPNPKNGTIAENPEEAVKKLSSGQISYKTESESPIIHARVGKISFEDNKLKENVKTFISTVGITNISSVTLKSTMSPAIRLDFLS